ncbi:MAG: cupin domain-containing protein [Gammaproteobacteria bacterium]|nr:MAG: cupin domain-containing protein [Gammaproteobacteria bacterium]
MTRRAYRPVVCTGPGPGADPTPGEESVEVLLDRDTLRVERIVSLDYSSPDGFWYDQPDDEWVTVLRGRGVLEFEDGNRVELGPGDWLDIPAHVRHRVAATHATEATVWLAVHTPAE